MGRRLNNFIGSFHNPANPRVYMQYPYIEGHTYADGKNHRIVPHALYEVNLKGKVFYILTYADYKNEFTDELYALLEYKNGKYYHRPLTDHGALYDYYNNTPMIPLSKYSIACLAKKQIELGETIDSDEIFDRIEEKKEDAKPIKVGDLFITPAVDLLMYDKNDDNSLVGFKEIKLDNGRINDVYIPIIIKYLGNGVFEEMVTHEKLGAAFDKGTLDGKDIVLDDYTELFDRVAGIKYDKYLEYNQKNNPNASKGDFYNYIDNLSRRIEEYPIGVDTFNLVSVSDDLKEAYSRISAKEREYYIQDVKEVAVRSAKRVTKAISNNLLEEKNNSLDMAYLENQIYDFEHKGKSK